MPSEDARDESASRPADSGRPLTTLVVGIEAACERVLTPLFVDGELPTLWRLFARGANDRLESQIPPGTASAWPSVYTGTNPGKHGVFDVRSFSGYDWSVVSGADVAAPPLWEYLSEKGRSSVVVNVPVTHPPREFDGALVPGYPAPENPPCHPIDVLEDVRSATGEYRVYPRHVGEKRVDRDDIVAEHVALAEMRGRTFQYLADRFEPDFGFVHFQGTDSVVHELPGDEDAIRDVYRAVDSAVAQLLDRFAPTNVFVASSHGIGPCEGYDVRLNEVLREAGYLSAVSGGRELPRRATVRESRLAWNRPHGRAEGGLLDNVTTGLDRIGLPRPRGASVLESLGLPAPLGRLLPSAGVATGTELVDFPNSRAYMRSPMECGVRINLAGREPAGTVPPGEYESVRDDLIELFAGLRTPDGDRVFENVGRREAFFHGPATEDAVDVVTVPADFDHSLSARLAGEVFGPPTEPWNHKYHGVIAAVGPDVDPGMTLPGATLLDVAPTVLATLGVPAAAIMDGSVLPCVEPVGTDRYEDVPRQPRVGSRADGDRDGDTGGEDLEERLADLDYFE